MANLMRGHLTSPDTELLARPIILIGAGRSGSTLFTRMLDNHPQIQFSGETDFLVARLWREVWENRFWFNFPLHMARRPRSSREPAASIDLDTIIAERERVAASLRGLFGDILRLRPDVDAWGYKEIWNGNDAVACYPWDSYDAVFPQATWVHLVRHPFDFLLSVARWNLQPVTEEFVGHELSHWAQMLAWNRQRCTRKNYIEIRYEDLKQHPKRTLDPILSSAGVEWSDECISALSNLVLHSPPSSPFSPAPPLGPQELRQIIAKIENLSASLDDLGYELPESFPQEVNDRAIIKELPEYVDLRCATRAH